VALQFFDDTHHEAGTHSFEQHSEDLFLWTPWHRVEVSDALRQFARGDKPVLREPDARRIIHRLGADVRADYFRHIEADWRKVLRNAHGISAAEDVKAVPWDHSLVQSARQVWTHSCCSAFERTAQGVREC